MKVQLHTTFSSLLAFEGIIAALDAFLEYGAISWKTRFQPQEFPGTCRTFVPLDEEGEEVEFLSVEAMLKVWGDLGEPGGRGSQLLRGKRLLPGHTYALGGGDGRSALWTGDFYLRWKNASGEMEVLVKTVADHCVVYYEGQRGSLLHYEFAKGSPVFVPLAQILKELYEECPDETLVFYETSESSKDWSPFSIEADHRPLWEMAYGGMPRRLWKQAQPLVDNYCKNNQWAGAEDMAYDMRPYYLGKDGWQLATNCHAPEEERGKEIRWAFSQEDIAEGYYLSVDREIENVSLGPMGG